MKKIIRYFSKTEIALFLISSFVIVVSAIITPGTKWQSITASLIGALSLILNAKGNPIGQLLMIIFSVLYGIISYEQRYYGEMITYLGMTAPMAAFSLVSWLKNPYNGKRSEVKTSYINKRQIIFLTLLTTSVTFFFYFVLRYFNTANLAVSTLSVATSFAAASLTFLRSPWFAAAYASNDIVLLILWGTALYKDISYLSVFLCFMIFLVNDLYGFYNWRKMHNRQAI